MNYQEGNKINGFEIVSSYKYLGVSIDCSLTMAEYFE
jgi:hypothetical protein